MPRTTFRGAPGGERKRITNVDLSVMKIKNSSKFLFLLLSLFIAPFAGCGSSSQEFVTQSPPAVNQSSGTIRLTQVLLRSIPSTVTRQRVTGFDAQGGPQFGPVLVNKAATIDLPGVSTAVVRIQIDYLQGDKVVGLGSIPVTIVAGQTTVINDPPFDDVTSALNSIQVTPAVMTIPDGTTQAYLATGTFADGSTANLTNLVTWASSDTTKATINASGLATAVDPGNSNISATLGPVSGSAVLNVSAATVTSIAVTPNDPSIAKGTQRQFTATATLTDGTTSDVSATAQWASTTTATATINNVGLATSVNPGQTTISATVGAVSGATTLTVTNATLTSLNVRPAVALSAPGSKRQYTAIATFSDNTTQDVTSQVNWTSNDTEVVVANDNLGPNKFGRASIDVNAAVGQTVTVTANLNGTNSSATLTLGAFAFAANLDGDTITPFVINTTTGALTAGTTLPTGDGPRTVAVHPSGLFVYTSNNFGNTVSVFSVNPTTGALTPGVAVATSTQPSTLAIEPTGRFLYTSDLTGPSGGGPGAVSVFSIDQTTGALTALSPRLPVIGFATALAVDSLARFLYVVEQDTNVITPFNINPTTGLLSAGPTFATTGTTPLAIAVHPTGRYIYTTNFNGDTVTPLTVGSNGALTAGTTVMAGDGPNNGVVDPTGRFLYVVNLNSSNVSVFSIDSGSGALVAGTAVAVGTGPRGVGVDPSGRFVYVANRGSNNVSLLTMNQATGALTFVGNTNAGTGPFSVGITP